MKNVFTSLLSLAVLAAAPFASQASGFGSEGTSIGLTAPKAKAAKGGEPFEVGTNVVNLGIGFGSSYGYVGTVSATPAFSASFERGFFSVGPGTIGIGGIVGYQSASSDYFTWKFKSTDLLVAARGAFHYPVTEAFDAYAGVALGFRSITYSAEGTGVGTYSIADYTGAYSAGFIGGRYFFTDAIGAFAELGYDQTYLKAGLSVKF